MKKVLFLPLTLLVSALTIGYVTKTNNFEKANAEEEQVKFIDMTADAFKDYSEEKGSFADANATFWGDGYSFNALGNFFRGETKESWKGTLELKPWKQYTQFIRFQWGGANPENALMKLEIHYGEYVSTLTNETFAENPLLMNYFKIPDEQFALLDKENGFDMYIKFIDDRDANYGFHNFGSLYVNQNEEEVSNAMRYYLNHLSVSDKREWNLNNNKKIYNFYLTNAHLKEVFLKSVDNANEDFENINNFVNHWYLDINYENDATDARHVDNALSNRAIRDGSNMPFNKTGASFFSGWHENNQGYVASDYPIYRFVSRPFVLGGTGLISVKMAGRSASLHVIDTETQEDLAWADLRTFTNSGDENKQYTGFNTVTMVRHYINLSVYLGKTIQLAIADVYTDNWASSYFDELITNYESYPSFAIDSLYQDNLVEKSYNNYFDQYIASTHIDNDANGLKYKLGKDDVTIVDESPIYEAYKFLRHYYSALRSEANEFNYDKASVETRKQLFDEYMALDNAAKEIVDKSSDLQYSVFDDGWHNRMANTTSKIATSFKAIIDEFKTYTVSFNANGGSGTMDSVSDIKGNYTLPASSFIAPEGKEFAGWKVNNTGELLAKDAVIEVNSDTEIFAQWKDTNIKYTVSFSANGGSGTMDAVNDIKGEYVLPECTFTAPKDQKFSGWKVDNTGDLLKPGEKIDVNNNVELVAEWEDIVKYIVTFNANGGTGTMSNIEVIQGEQLVLPACTFVAPEGKEFECWIIRNELYKVGDKVDISVNTEVFAKWKIIPVVIDTYTVSFDANGGTGEMSDVTDVNGEYTLPSCSFTAPEGKEFDCWLVNNEQYQPGQKVEINADTVITASWKEVEVVPPSSSSSEPASSLPEESSAESAPVSEASSSEGSSEPEVKKGCGGEIVSISIATALLSLVGITLIASKKRKN